MPVTITHPSPLQSRMGEVIAALPVVARWLLLRYPYLMLSGGFVRDTLAGLKPRDLDLCILGTIPDFDTFGPAINPTARPDLSLSHMLAEPEEWLAGMQAAAEWGDAEGGVSHVDGERLPPVDLCSYTLTHSDRAITLHPRSGAFDRENHQIQIIRHTFADERECFESFDFTVCQAGVRIRPGPQVPRQPDRRRPRACPGVRDRKLRPQAACDAQPHKAR